MLDQQGLRVPQVTSDHWVHKVPLVLQDHKVLRVPLGPQAHKVAKAAKVFKVRLDQKVRQATQANRALKVQQELRLALKDLQVILVNQAHKVRQELHLAHRVLKVILVIQARRVLMVRRDHKVLKGVKVFRVGQDQ